MKKGIGIFGLFVLLAVFVWFLESQVSTVATEATRNGYGEGTKREQYELTIPGELEGETLEMEIYPQEYTEEGAKVAIQELLEKLDSIVLGENEDFNHVEQDLHLVTQVEGYPMRIQWELSSYEVLDIEGHIRAPEISKEGEMVELKGHITYEDQSAVYLRSVMVYPVSRQGKALLIHEIRQALKKAEEETRQEKRFSLPTEVGGQPIQWKQKQESSWYYILILGGVLATYVVYREREQKKRADKLRKETLLREYPGLLTKMTMLLSTGATVKSTWEKIVKNYEKQRLPEHLVYEEMKTTYYEMQGGVLETEAYERFGRRCELTEYVKFGALLSQNLRKGSKGLCDLMRMEAIQSFENRKSNAKRKGEEAGAKLMMPMIGMLAVVLIMVMVPAFLSMKL